MAEQAIEEGPKKKEKVKAKPEEKKGAGSKTSVRSYNEGIEVDKQSKIHS